MSTGHVRQFYHNRRAEYACKLKIANGTSDATTTSKYDSGCYIYHVDLFVTFVDLRICMCQWTQQMLATTFHPTSGDNVLCIVHVPC